MLLSRQKRPLTTSLSSYAPASPTASSQKNPIFEKIIEFLKEKDYQGVLAVIEYKSTLPEDPEIKQYLSSLEAYCYFHLHDFEKAKEIYNRLGLRIYEAICLYYCGDYQEAEILANQEVSSGRHDLTNSALLNRLLFHVSHKISPTSEEFMRYHRRFSSTSIEDQLCLASVHYLRGHYQEAIDIYKTLLGKDKESPSEHLALNVYIAMSYYKLEFYDIAKEILAVYLHYLAKKSKKGSVKPEKSFIAENLLNCISYKLGDRSFLPTLALSNSCSFMKEILTHNSYVFKLAIDSESYDSQLEFNLKRLVGIVPEARSNLSLYYLKNDMYKESFELYSSDSTTDDLDGTVDYLVKAASCALYFQSLDLSEKLDAITILKNSIDCYRVIGMSTTECDTISGRQAMFASLFLEGYLSSISERSECLAKWEESMIYLDSIKPYLQNDETFCINYIQLKLLLVLYGSKNVTSEEVAFELEPLFKHIKSYSIKNTIEYIKMLLYVYVKQRNYAHAWVLCKQCVNGPEFGDHGIQLINNSVDLQESLSVTGKLMLLRWFASLCFEAKSEQAYFYAAKAYDEISDIILITENDGIDLDISLSEVWKAKKMSCLGYIKIMSLEAANEGTEATLAEIIMILRKQNKCSPEADDNYFKVLETEADDIITSVRDFFF